MKLPKLKNFGIFAEFATSGMIKIINAYDQIRNPKNERVNKNLWESENWDFDN